MYNLYEVLVQFNKINQRLWEKVMNTTWGM